MASAPPPTYEDAVIRRVNEHYLTCTESSNEEYLKRYTRQRVATFAVRGWVVSNRGTTVVVGPWWMDGGSHKTWEMFKPTPDESAKPTLNPAARERLVRWLRSLRRLPIEQETRSIFAVNGTPIQPDEIEYTLTAESGHDDWTKEWGWKVRLRAYTYAKHIGCSRWTITYRLYLDDLPSLLRAGGISWEDAVVNNGEDRFEEDPYPYPNRRWNWARSSLCLPASQSGQKWKAKVNERHREQSSLERDFRCRLSTETVYKAQISQRTGARKYKVVMIYDLDTVYGNDISGQRVDVWHDGLAERFAEFIRPLVPAIKSDGSGDVKGELFKP